MLRGTPAGLEFVFGAAPFEDSAAEMFARLEERPQFYDGVRGVVVFDDATLPAAGEFARFVDSLRRFRIELTGVYGSPSVAAVGAGMGLSYLGLAPRLAVASFAKKRAARAGRTFELSERAKSLEADFAGARAEIARRRARGESSVPKPDFRPAAVDPGSEPLVTPAPALAAVPRLPESPTTIYHRGTLRGGQALQQLGNIVVAGDVNPGAELVASGDIVVFGALRGTAHAGAQGDAGARVLALEMAPTQLRIATFIAAGDERVRVAAPSVAFVDGERITIAPYAGGVLR